MENIKHLKYFLQALFLHFKRIQFYFQSEMQSEIGVISCPIRAKNYWNLNEKAHISSKNTKLGTCSYVFNVKFLHRKFTWIT